MAPVRPPLSRLNEGFPHTKTADADDCHPSINQPTPRTAMFTRTSSYLKCPSKTIFHYPFRRPFSSCSPAADDPADQARHPIKPSNLIDNLRDLASPTSDADRIEPYPVIHDVQTYPENPVALDRDSQPKDVVSNPKPPERSIAPSDPLKQDPIKAKDSKASRRAKTKSLADLASNLKWNP